MRVFLALLLVFSLGVGTSMLQVLAWATMIPTQLVETGSVAQAVEKTFSGDYPCAMCELAAVKARAEKKSESQPLAPGPKDEKQAPLVLFPSSCPRTTVYPPREILLSCREAVTAPVSFSVLPETPPPDLG